MHIQAFGKGYVCFPDIRVQYSIDVPYGSIMQKDPPENSLLCRRAEIAVSFMQAIFHFKMFSNLAQNNPLCEPNVFVTKYSSWFFPKDRDSLQVLVMT